MAGKDNKKTLERPYSVIYGRDKDVLPVLFKIHASGEDILDCTYNKGRMWKGLPYKPLRMDISNEYEVDVVADFRDMPFKDESFDVMVFDPPHLPVAAGDGTIYTKYNVHKHDSKGDNISDMFVPFLKEAKRVLKPNGVIFAKIADLVHNHKYQWQHIDFVNCVKDIGLTACDMIIKVDPCGGNLKDNRWVNVKHFRKCHCYWIVVRKGKCEK